MLQIVASLIDAARGIIYDRHMFVVQATGLKNLKKLFFVPTYKWDQIR
jgi:hypothetical protein